MKRFGKFRDPRFVLNTLQNPFCEVRTRAELIQAAQKALQPQPDTVEIPADPPPAALASSDPPEQFPKPPADPEPIQAAPPSPEPAPDFVEILIAPPSLEPAPDSVEIYAEPPSAAPDPEPAAAAPQAPPTELPQPPAKPRAAKARRQARKPSRKQPKVTTLPKPSLPPEPPNVISPDTFEKFALRVVKRVAPRSDGSSELADLERHTRKCAICHHPNLEYIEEEFVNWRNVALIQEDYKIRNYASVYRHARATGLYQRRRENLRFAAELLIEHADQAEPKPDTILRAIHTCARISAHGEWIEPHSHLVFSRADRPAPPAPPAPPEPPQLAPESAPHPQLPAGASTSTDDANPSVLIDTAAIRK